MPTYEDMLRMGMFLTPVPRGPYIGSPSTAVKQVRRAAAKAARKSRRANRGNR